MRTNDRLNSVEHIWHPESSRWIYIERYASGYLGLNCMQGDEYEYFKKHYGKIDKGMSEFYITMKSDLIALRVEMSELEFIDKVMWMYWESKYTAERYKLIRSLAKGIELSSINNKTGEITATMQIL